MLLEKEVMVQKESFQSIISQQEPVLVDFYADWCGPCQMMSSVVQEMAEEFRGRLRVLKVDIDRNPAVAAKYGVRGVPTFIIFRNAQILWQHSGAMPAHQFRHQLEQYVS